MILTFKGQYGSTIDLHREGEIQGYEFLEPPVEFRFVRNGVPLSDWATPVCGYVSLLHPEVNDSIVTTRGIDAMHLAIETRGQAGTFTLLVWPG
ncbi:MAG TPA: hypothetical protein VFO40_26910 [Chthoniobacterales bacterium]|nr:hypothetical protein [Chthoniobacterales bacterium]